MAQGGIRRVAGALAAAAVAVGALAPVGRPAQAVPGFAFSRLEGADRYETAQRIAENSFATGADTALIATGERFPDALAGGFLAGNRTAPVLLTRTAALPAAAKSALSTLRVRNVVVLGGTAAVSAAVETELRNTDSTAAGGGKLSVSRIGGTDRYDTARQVAAATGTTVGTVGGKKTALLATGDKFADALAAGPASYASRLPVLLTPGAPAGTLHPQAKAALQALAIEHVVILGGTAAISSSVETEVRAARGAGSITTSRLEGSDRTETAVAIANYAHESLGFARTHANLSRGDDPGGFADALAGGSHGGRERAPVLLTETPTVLASPANTGAERYLRDNAGTLAEGHIFGGRSAVSDGVESQAEAAAGASAAPPQMSGAVANPATEVVTVTYSRPVTCANDAATRGQFAFAGASPTTPASIACNGTTAVTLTFTAVTAGGALTYTDDNAAASDANDVKSTDGAQARSPDTITATVTADVTAPQMSAAVANPAAETVTVTYSEAVNCANSGGTRAQFAHTGATPQTPTGIACNGTATVTLTFLDVTAAGTLTYTDDDANAEANDVTDLAGNQARSPDSRSVTVGGDQTRPDMTTAVANTTSETVTVTYSEPVVCTDDVGTRLQFAYAGAGVLGTPTGVFCNGTTAVTLTFADVVSAANLTYTDDAPVTDPDDVRDLAGNQAVSPDVVTAVTGTDTTQPFMASALANTAANTVTVTYSEAVTCTDSVATRQQFSYAGAATATPESVLCNGTTTVTLVFDDVTGAGALTYTDEAAVTDASDVRDVAGNQARSPDGVTATATTDTTRPSMASAAANTANETVTVTYSEAVACTDGALTRAQFVFTGAAGASPLDIDCNGTTAVTLLFADVTAGGDLTYTDESPSPDASDVRDLAGNQAQSPQTVAATTSSDTTRPSIASATANAVANTVTATYSEAVTCTDDAATRAQFTFTGATAGPTGVFCNASPLVTLAFADVVAAGTLTYTDESGASDANDVRDLAGNQAVSPDTEAVTLSTDVTRPSMASAVSSAANETVTVTYSEAVTCADTPATRAQFGYAGATPATPTAIACNGTTTVVLTFTDVTAGGALTYTDDNAAAVDATDVRDLAGNQANTPQSVTAA